MKLGESQVLKMSHTPTSGHLFFRFFQRFSKKKQFLRIVETYFLISFIRLGHLIFPFSGKSIFLVRAILLLVEIIIEVRRK